jgi:hypothetical protein
MPLGCGSHHLPGGVYWNEIIIIIIIIIIITIISV